jgi:hypothetical protein
MEKLAKFLVATVLLFIPLYPKFPLLRVEGTYVSVRLEDVLIAGIGSFFLYYLLREDRWKFLFKKPANLLFLSICSYLLVGAVSLASGVLISSTVDPKIGFLHWLRRAEYFSTFFVGLTVIRYSSRISESLNFFVNTLLVTVFIVFLYGVGQRYLYWPIIITQNEEYSKGVALRYVEGGHINSTFAGHYDLGTFLVMILPLFLLISVTIKNNIKYIYALGFLTGLWLLVNSASRISLVSYLISSVLALVLSKKSRFIPFLLVVTLLFTLFSNSLLLRYKRIIEVSIGKVIGWTNSINYVVRPVYGATEKESTSSEVSSSTAVFEDRSSSIRINVEWPRAIRAFVKNPLLGTGYSSITLATDNDYLRMLGEVGLLGFISFMLIIFHIFVWLLRGIAILDKEYLELVYVRSLLSSIPGVLLNAVFIDVFEASKFALIFWLLMGFAVGVSMTRFLEKYEKRNN